MAEMIAKLIGKIVCWWRGHKRGRFDSNVMEQGSTRVVAKMYICPRCDTTWTRKVKA